jgi:hypothetical protein
LTTGDNGRKEGWQIFLHRQSMNMVAHQRASAVEEVVRNPVEGYHPMNASQLSSSLTLVLSQWNHGGKKSHLGGKMEIIHGYSSMHLLSASITWSDTSHRRGQHLVPQMGKQSA